MGGVDPNPVVHSTTFGGNPIACAAGIAAINVTLEEDLPGQAAVKGEFLLKALGSLQKKYKPRDIVLPDQFVDRTKRSSEHTFFGRGIVAHIAFADPICPELRQLLYKSCRAEGARVHNGGTYVNMEGPAFSTRAESLTNHALGYDVIGMTNLGEAKCAREAEIAYATMAMIISTVTCASSNFQQS